MKRILFGFMFMVFVFSSSVTSAQHKDQSQCDEKLSRIKQLDNNKEKLKKLDALAEKCSGHLETNLEVTGLMLALGMEGNADWLKRSLDYCQKAIQIDSVSIKARWNLAQVLEYLGEYSAAVIHYQWVYDNIAKDDITSRQSLSYAEKMKFTTQSRIHAITCKFLASNIKLKDIPSVDKATIEPARIDVSEKSIRERAGWTFFKEMVGAVAILGGMTTLQGEGQQIQYSLQLLFDWIEAPAGQKVEARNNFLAGMISSIATIVAEKGLDMKLGTLISPTTGEKMPSMLPPANYGEILQYDFAQQSPESGRKFDISNDLSITEAWENARFTGSWNQHCNFMEGGRSFQSSGYITVTQNGNMVNISYRSGEDPNFEAKALGSLLDQRLMSHQSQQYMVR